MAIFCQILFPFVVAFIAAATAGRALLWLSTESANSNNSAAGRQVASVESLGGIAIFMGIAVALAATCIYTDCSRVFVLFVAMLVMMCTGVMDSLKRVSWWLRFVMQILALVLVMHAMRVSIGDFHGILGLESLSGEAEYAVTLVAMMALMNSLRMMGGADGMLLLFSIWVCVLFGCIFAITHDIPLMVLCVASVGAMIPLFAHKGICSKLKLSTQSSSLMLGVMFAGFVMVVFTREEYSMVLSPVSVPVLMLSVFAVPVADALRVTVGRMIHPGREIECERKDIYHMHIESGLPHLLCLMVVLLLNMLTVYSAFWAALNGWNALAQLWVVLLVGAICSWGLCSLVYLLERLLPEQMQRFRNRSNSSL